MIEVALFPIPNAVAFPGTVFPLHVFEPRYRKLVDDCVRDDRMVGVSHVVKAIHTPPVRPQNLKEALQLNQATYKPQEVFSAGVCEVLERTPDGRILANINIRERLVLVNEVQSLPYRIVNCQPLLDQPDSNHDDWQNALQQQIHERLLYLVKEQDPSLAQALETDSWFTLAASEYTFKIFQFLRFDADTMQSILESQSPNARLEMIWHLLQP